MSRLCIVTALPAETRPLLDALTLRQSKARHLRLYGSPDYLLLETGVGKLNAAAAVGAVLQAHPEIDMVANLGIAGGLFDYADVRVAHHVKDNASGAQWFPHLPHDKAFRDVATASVSTRDTPDTQYCEGVLFDMEAAGVFNAACRYLSTSQVHSIKVVSDNPECDITSVTSKSVITLVEQALPAILPLLEALQTLDLTTGHEQKIRIEAFINQITHTTHHSVNDKQLLTQLVQQHVAISNELPSIDNPTGSAKDIRRTLKRSLSLLSFVYGS
ncbi:MAG: hypothetical protein AB8B97_05810 [Granulosicoccus sp.]